jgi:hypothetical protein
MKTSARIVDVPAEICSWYLSKRVSGIEELRELARRGVIYEFCLNHLF